MSLSEDTTSRTSPSSQSDQSLHTSQLSQGGVTSIVSELLLVTGVDSVILSILEVGSKQSLQLLAILPSESSELVISIMSSGNSNTVSPTRFSLSDF